ncbi:MAG: hypothetical protein KKB77_01380, partial [Bacteroidetes bacterium]|nr:hypothetical protein [Bacteroidota bacterium]
MKYLFFVSIVLFIMAPVVLIAQDKTTVKYNELFKQYEYYDSYGRKIGTSKYNDLFKQYDHYDSYGRKEGTTKYNDL